MTSSSPVVSVIKTVLAPLLPTTCSILPVLNVVVPKINEKAEVVAHVIDRVFGTAEVDIAALSRLPWPEACKAAAHSMFDALERHRNVTPLLVGNVPVGPNALAAREQMIAFLLANKFSPDLAARSYALLSRYVLGFAIQLTDGHTGVDDAGLARMFHNLDSSQFPATVAVADHLPVPFDEEFDFGLELIVNGLAAALTHETPPKKGTRSSR